MSDDDNRPVHGIVLTTFSLAVLHRADQPLRTLEAALSESDTGYAVGYETGPTTHPVPPTEVRMMLRDFGSDGSFFDGERDEPMEPPLRIATLAEVKSELEKLDIYSRVAEIKGFLNVWIDDNMRRFPVATVWPPDTRMTPPRPWTWGHHYEYETPADAPAAAVALHIKRTLPVVD